MLGPHGAAGLADEGPPAVSPWPSTLATLAAGAACLVALGLCTVRFPRSARRTPLQALLISAALWCATFGVVHADVGVPVLVQHAAWVAATTGLVAALWFVHRELLEATWVSPSARVLIVWAGVQVAAVAVVLEGHVVEGQVQAELARVSSMLGEDPSRISWDRVLLAAFFATLWARTRVAARQAPPVPGRPLGAVAATTALAALTAAASIPEPNALGGLDLLPWTAALVALVAADSLLRTGLHAVTPPSLRDTLDSLPGAVMVLDATLRVVALNRTAGPLAAPALANVRSVLGASAGRVLHPALLSALGTPSPSFSVTVGERQLFVARSSITDRLGGTVGTVLVAHDAAALAVDRASLRAASQDLEVERGRLEAQNVHLLLELSATEAARTRLAEDSIRDALTGLHNRRRLTPALEGALAEARRNGTGVAVYVVDIDHFKRVNDTHGHPVGDRVLQAIATELIASGRPTDHVVRFGGEEFVVIDPGSDPLAALRRAEDIRGALSRVRVRLRQDVDDTTDLSVTVSVGVASYPRNGASATELLVAADNALYAAKDSGRDCVVAA